MWIKPLHVCRLALTVAAFTVQTSPRLRHRYSRARNKSCVEHMVGEIRDVKRGESTWKQMKRYDGFPQPLQQRQRSISLIWRFNGQPEATCCHEVERAQGKGKRERGRKPLMERRREAGRRLNQKTEINYRGRFEAHSANNTVKQCGVKVTILRVLIKRF